LPDSPTNEPSGTQGAAMTSLPFNGLEKIRNPSPSFRSCPHPKQDGKGCVSKPGYD
jgi:hypothetical protein